MTKLCNRVGLCLSTLFLVFWSSAAFPCSSCGSGAADPLILNPSETNKFYLGLGEQGHFHEVDNRGDVRRDLGPNEKQQIEIAFAHRLATDLFVSLVSGVGRNVRDNHSENGVLDTSLNMRYTALNQSLAEIWLPQVQLILSQRFKTTRSVQDARKEHYLDSFGAGYNETFYGADVWFGMLPVMFGGSVLRSVPWEADTISGRLLAGPIQKEILTVGYMLVPELKAMTGAVFETRAAIRLDGKELGDSDRKTHDLFLTFETVLSGLDNFRLNFSRKAVFGENKNATVQSSATLAWMRTL